MNHVYRMTPAFKQITVHCKECDQCLVEFEGEIYCPDCEDMAILDRMQKVVEPYSLFL